MPLEMHVLHFNYKYGSQAEAVKHNDGLLTVVYFFIIQSYHSPAMHGILSYLKDIRINNTATAIPPFILTDLIYPIDMDYYLYFGSIEADQYNPSMLWIICRHSISISVDQLKLFHLLLDSRMRPIYRNFTKVAPHFDRNLFHVNPKYNMTNTTLSIVPRDFNDEHLCKERYGQEDI